VDRVDDAAGRAWPPAHKQPMSPSFKGDPAKSESEAGALGYMRTVLRAQKQYKKKNNKFAPVAG